MTLYGSCNLQLPNLYDEHLVALFIIASPLSVYNAKHEDTHSNYTY